MRELVVCRIREWCAEYGNVIVFVSWVVKFVKSKVWVNNVLHMLAVVEVLPYSTFSRIDMLGKPRL